MSSISSFVLCLSGLFILLGFLLGYKRGGVKQGVRLILIIVSFVMALSVRKQVTDIVLNTPVSEGKTLVALIAESFNTGEPGMEGLVDVMTSVITMILQVFSFIISFYVYKGLSMIVYWIIGAIISSFQKGKISDQINKNNEIFAENKDLSYYQKQLISEIKKDEESLQNKENLNKKEANAIHNRLYNNKNKLIKVTLKQNRKPFLGGIIGIVQGIIISLFVVSPISGLISDTSSVVNAISDVRINDEKIVDQELIDGVEQVGLLEYSDTTIAKVYKFTGGWLYKMVSTLETKEGDTSSLQDKVEAVEGGLEMFESVYKITEIDTSSGFTTDVKNQVVVIFDELDSIKEGMSEESVEELDGLIKDVVGPIINQSDLGVSFDLEEIDFTKVDFSNEGEVVSSLYDVYEKAEITDEAIEEVVVSLSNSELVLPLMNQFIESMPEENRPILTEGQKEVVLNVLDELENKDNVEEIKKIFSIE